jgi:predicted nucleic acid-binding protein
VALTVLDASVLIAFLDPEDPHHVHAVSALSVSDSEFVLPASAYAEALVHPQEQGPSAVAHVRSLVAELPIRIEPIDREIAGRAAELRTRVRLPDALVLATGDVLAADVVLTADDRWRTVSRRVRVI